MPPSDRVTGLDQERRLSRGAGMWLMNYALGGALPAITHIFPLQLSAITLLIGPVEVVWAALIGAAICQEEGHQLSRAAAK
jgi:hypothetical protein